MTAGASFAAEGVEAQTEKVKRSVKFDRGLNVPSSTFIQKGLWTTGFKASYADYNMSNYQFLLIDDIHLNGYSVDVSAHLGYSFSANMMIGARFGYDRTIAGVGNASLSAAVWVTQVRAAGIGRTLFGDELTALGLGPFPG